MAGADYQHCSVCYAKAFYDANIDWSETNARQVGTICREEHGTSNSRSNTRSIYRHCGA
jgi:hypothetical protein